MRRIILSVNENPEYLFYVPLVCWAWEKFNWYPFIINCTNGRNELSEFVMQSVPNKKWTETILDISNSEYKTETWAQISRLFASSSPAIGEEDYLMTSDIDMLPLTDYWIDRDWMSVYGHDLTNFQHIPICYVGMISLNWRVMMGIPKQWDIYTATKLALDILPNAKSDDSVKRWVVDQDLLTEKLNKNQWLSREFIKRGILGNGYPIGRVDRSAWTLEHKRFIDCHMLRGIWRDPDALAKTLLLLYQIWPNEDFTWFTDYTKEFAKLVNNG